jgi:hypothetical protein
MSQVDELPVNPLAIFCRVLVPSISRTSRGGIWDA